MPYLRPIARFVVILVMALTVTSCVKDSQFGGLVQGTFSVTPKCGINERVFRFTNTTEDTLHLAGAVMAPGTNGAGHFSIQGFQIGSATEIPSDVAGGISPVDIPQGSPYAIRVRYSPLEESGESFHAAVLDMSFNGDNPGIIQVELFGVSEGVADCPEVEEGGAEGLSGPVDLTITFMVASTGGLGVPLTTEMGVDPFDQVSLDAGITGTDFAFPQIAFSGNFILPAPDPSVPALAPILSVVSGDTLITTSAAVTGTFDAATGALILPTLRILLEDNNSTLVLEMPFTTGSVDPLDVPNERLIAADFTIIDGMIVGLPVQDDGTIHLVGTTLVTEGTGPLSAAVGLDIAVRIEATVLCAGEDDTVCDGE